jgi:hypothetical protein
VKDNIYIDEIHIFSLLRRLSRAIETKNLYLYGFLVHSLADCSPRSSRIFVVALLKDI